MSIVEVAIKAATDAETEVGPGSESFRVLVVDDSAIDRRWVGGLLRHRRELTPIYARSGIEALAILEEDPPSIVLTDLQMPEMDGLRLVEEIRDRFPLVPVVLMTAHGSEEIALQALRHGAVSYVPKRRLARELLGTIEQVLDSLRVRGRNRGLKQSATKTVLEFVVDNNPNLAQDLVARFREEAEALDLFDKNVATRVDVALQEALLNGIYHGNLEVSSDLREDGEGPFLALAAERRGVPPFSDRRLRVVAELDRDQAVFTIEDQGPGFDPTKLPDPLDPANLERASGRGLMLIRTFMDQVTFNDAGNRVTLTKQSKRHLTL